MSEQRIITVQLTRPKGFKPVSWLIRKIQRTPYSHVRFYWRGVGGSVPVVYEASGRMLKFLGPIAQEQAPVEVIKKSHITVSRDGYIQFVAFCMRYAGVEYGRWQLIGMGIADAFGMKKNPFGDGRRTQVCSEVAVYFFKDVLGWDVSELPADRTGPREIGEYLEAKNPES